MKKFVMIIVTDTDMLNMIGPSSLKIPFSACT